MQNASRFTLTALAVGIAGVMAAGTADASGFQIRENSVQNLGRANAGTTVAWGDASVVLNNPAALVNNDRMLVQADVTVIDLNADFDGSGTSAVGTPLTGGNGGDPGEATPVPHMGFVMPLSGGLESVVVGASVSAPFGLKTEYDPTWMGRYDAVVSDVKIVDLTFSAGIAFTERFSLGAGIILQRADVTLSNAIDFGTALCAAVNPANCFNPAYPFQPQGADGMVEVSGDDTGVGFVVGAQLRAADNFVLGYAHRSEIKHTLDGTADFTMPAAVAATFAGMGIHAYDDGPIWANLTTPSTDTISARWDVTDQFRLLGEVQWTGWESLQEVDIRRPGGAVLGQEPFEWEDSIFYSVGGEFDFSEAFTFRFGVGYDESPTHDATRTPRLPDQERMVYTLGATWNVSPQLSIDAAYMRVEIDSPYVNTESASGSNLVGMFDGNADLLGIAARYRF